MKMLEFTLDTEKKGNTEYLVKLLEYAVGTSMKFPTHHIVLKNIFSPVLDITWFRLIVVIDNFSKKEIEHGDA